ncbi:family 16 glycosylhydrolase [Thalassospira profundimaris]|uniref:family 16 glycosylhydrolase n=1 Tax=Thalassospira profundimaris TaxID=502049 RepID=UPI0002F952E3|nr:family 16 glycosylhydrolase [Thalassospira profundimaris]
MINRRCVVVSGILFSLFAMTGCQTWQTAYEDDYNYPTAKPFNAKFNTWFWREDATGTHVFNYIDTPGNAGPDKKGCFADAPCVKLTAPVYAQSGNTKPPYINAEMYNNSCARQGPGHPDKQPYDRLLDPVNPLLQSITFIQPAEMHANIKKYCDLPYPYRPVEGVAKQGPFAEDSWNTTTKTNIAHNYLALIADKEALWKWYRDIGFNNIYLANDAVSSRIVANVRADGTGGGSRGWGYWNTTMNPLVMQFAWFMEVTTEKKPPSSGFDNNVWMMTVRGGSSLDFCLTPLSPEKYSIYDWHQYSVEWTSKSVQYFVDDVLVADHRKYIPDIGLAFHNWVDNRNYGKYGPPNYALKTPKTNLINQFAVYEQKPTGQQSLSPVSVNGTTCGSVPFDKDINEIEKLIKMIIEAYE